MSIITGLSVAGHLTEAIFHFNGALDQIDAGSGYVEIARSLYDCLNKLQTEWVHYHPGTEGEIAGFTKMVLGAVSLDEQIRLLRSTELQKLSALDPPILNHKTLTKGGYRPGLPIDPSLKKSAMEEHHKLQVALRESSSNRSEELMTRVLKRAATLLYVVRSNIAHGEKTPFGPDLDKRARDESVCQAIVPLQLLLIDRLFERSSDRLAVYGTLAPGQPNAAVLAGVVGSWNPCTVRGRVTKSSGLKTLQWNPSGEEVHVLLFQSKDMPHHWSRLDEFEGSRYVRRLVLVHLPGTVAVAYTYLASEARN